MNFNGSTHSDSDSDSEFDFLINDLVDDHVGNPAYATINENSSLPLKHFNLGSHPFADCVNPEFFFRTESHEEAFLMMKQCIEDGISLGLTTAISGTGKTLLTQVLLQELDPRKFQSILVLSYPGMSRTALLTEIANELQIEGIGPNTRTQTLIEAIQNHIIDLYTQDIRLVVMIDEVHFLNAEALHILRTLSNIEVPESKLLTILLFGEDIFLKKMSNPKYRAIFSRMFMRTEIRPLSESETSQYIKYRLLVAGGSPNLFDDSAIAAAHVRGQGIPREINRICHNAMMLAAREGLGTITRGAVEKVPAALHLSRG